MTELHFLSNRSFNLVLVFYLEILRGPFLPSGEIKTIVYGKTEKEQIKLDK